MICSHKGISMEFLRKKFFILAKKAKKTNPAVLRQVDPSFRLIQLNGVVRASVRFTTVATVAFHMKKQNPFSVIIISIARNVRVVKRKLRFFRWLLKKRVNSVV